MSDRITAHAYISGHTSIVFLIGGSVILVIALIVVVLLVVILIGVIVVVIGIISGIVAPRSSTSDNSTGRILADDKVAQAGINEQVKDALSCSVEGLGLRLCTQGGDGTVDVDSRVDKRRDAPEFSGGGESGISTDILCIAIGKRVGILLGGDVSDGSVNGILTSTQLGDDLVGGNKLHLLAYVDSVIRIRQDKHTLSQAFAPPRRSLMEAPAMVAAAPASPPWTAEMMPWVACS
jgi:hypothetical protein